MNHAVGVPKPRISTLASTFVRMVTFSASCTAGVAQQAGDAAQRHLREERDDRDREERERDPVQSASSAVNAPRGTYLRGGSPKP